MRRILTIGVFLLAATGLVITAFFVLEGFRQKGDISLRTREKAGMKFAVNDTLTHGWKNEAHRWSASHVDEIVTVAGGKPTGIRRTYVSFEMDASGPPRPTALSAVVLLDSNGARLEPTGQPFTSAPTCWPDPFYGALPEGPVHHFAEWESSYPKAVAIASFLARAPATGAHLVSKLEPDVDREGIECWRIRSGLEATLEDGRSLKMWGDLFFDKKAGILLDLEWVGNFDSEKGEEQVTFIRQRRPRK
jgi:hypothetical protein